MRILVTGSEEYLGCLRAPMLIAGAAQLHQVFDHVALDLETFTGRGHNRLKQIQCLLKTGQVDDQLFWSPANHDPSSTHHRMRQESEV
jgi:hypothetical protein